jgi:sensor domain CHASE-containing protein
MKNNSQHVPWIIFAFVVALIIGFMGWFMNALAKLSDRVDAATASNNEIRIQLGEIRTDVSWIKKTIEAQNKLKQSEAWQLLDPQ